MNAIAPPHIATAPLGQHVIAEFYGASHLQSCAPFVHVLRDAAAAADAVVLDVRLHDFGERAGFTGIALLAESHISVHTWPEYGYAAVDIFMCGDADTGKSLDVLRAYFSPTSESVTVLKRGAPATVKLPAA